MLLVDMGMTACLVRKLGWLKNLQKVETTVNKDDERFQCEKTIKF